MFQKIINGGVTATDSPAKARAIRLFNLVCLTAIGNTSLLLIMFWYFLDVTLLKVGASALICYSLALTLTQLGYSVGGRALMILSGNVIVFWATCYFRGQAGLQYFFFSIVLAPLMFFSWEERRWYVLALATVGLMLYGELNDYTLLESALPSWNPRPLRIFCFLAVLNQLTVSFFYFLKQNVKFEKESRENLIGQVKFQKMAALVDMAGGMAHEINNPLTVVLGSAGIIGREIQKADTDKTKLTYHVESIQTSVKRISTIIKSLRFFSRNTSHDPFEIVSLSTIIVQTLDLCREKLLMAGIKIDVQVPQDLKVACRPAEISQVLLNLLLNSYDALEGEAVKTISIKAIKGVGEVKVLVEDTGPGIPGHLDGKIMEPFFTTKEVGRGAGLGLSICKGIIEGHGGTLTLLSGTPKTTFEIVLPEAQS